jgi:hypothetical protein
MSIWHDSIVAATIIHHLYDIKHPAFYELRLLNRTWYDAYHEALHTMSDYEIACELLHSLLIYTPADCDKKYHFHKKIYKTRSKACAKYGRPELARCAKRIKYAIKYDCREFIYDYIRGQFAEDLKRDNLWSSDLRGIAVKYNRAAIFNILWDYVDECKDPTVVEVLVHMEDDFLTLAMQHCAYKILRIYEDYWMEHVNYTHMDIRDNAKCKPLNRKNIIEEGWDVYTILDFVNLVDFKECNIVLNHIRDCFGYSNNLYVEDIEDHTNTLITNNINVLRDVGIAKL